VDPNTRSSNLHAIGLCALLQNPALLPRAYKALAAQLRLRDVPVPALEGEAMLWDAWEVIALLARIPSEVARQGRVALEYAVREGWPASTGVGPSFIRDMLVEAVHDADAAFLRWLSVLSLRQPFPTSLEAAA
jgi:hypothetical protein